MLCTLPLMQLTSIDQNLLAIEFFSGIGAFAQAVDKISISIIAAFDQNEAANSVYEYNFGLKPVNRNLDTITVDEIPQADLWWMSPPCTPYSVRGNRKDINDPRAKSLLNLISILPMRQPNLVLLENVQGFVNSQVHQLLMSALRSCAYHIQEYQFCPTQFGIPMRRPRHYIVANKNVTVRSIIPHMVHQPIAEFLDPESSIDLAVVNREMQRYGNGLDIIDPTNSTSIAICFTRGYWKCLKASGSFLALPDGSIRRFAPREILRLLGFSSRFNFPANIDTKVQLRLLGNSVDVRAIELLLESLQLPLQSETAKNQKLEQLVNQWG